ncbi:MAG: chorismate-binding protein [Sinobacteraceae bacterium]|nr:chorismate-binding protein [Nevskiaceae bacterium]MCP5339162.1 chorismate-binding protein [Nevskiaceae bacterium]MCP5360466.1 chorismate-binding protein [Nevskiaceae bacterium]MCP5472109.1 chorismate-binding protein [Nevskiaceae bacterium]
MGGRARRLLVRELVLPANVLLRLAECRPTDYPVLFDSASRGPLARYSVLVAADADHALWLDPDGRVVAAGEARPHALVAGSGGFLAALQAWWREVAAEAEPPAQMPAETGRSGGAAAARPDPAPGIPAQPWAGGFVVFAGYELAAEVEPRLQLPPISQPYGAFALRTRGALVADLEWGRVWAVSEPDAEGADRLRRLEADATAALVTAPARPAVVAAAVPGAIRIEEDDPARFLQQVAQIQEHIRAGDLYQANLSRGWRAALPEGADLDALYRRLRASNPAPFAVRAHWRGMSILSSSPERLLQIADGRVSTRPIAGTRPRQPDDALQVDQATARELVAHPKERAEHVMLIDLERNDLGRICEAGTVRVDDFMTVETYAHVHHIVSGVSGRLRADVTPVGALRAVFPGGTITGCPKLRCMQVIGALEGEARGAYTGSIGMLGLDGSADFNILIRTLTWIDGTVSLRAGAGIVADSVAERELEETRAKARGVLAALGAGAS